MEDIGSGNWGNDDEDAFVFPEKNALLFYNLGG